MGLARVKPLKANFRDTDHRVRDEDGFVVFIQNAPRTSGTKRNHLIEAM
jgi:hypothetical protein